MQFARLPGHRLHLHAGQRRPAVPSEPVEAFRRCEHRRHRRHGVRFHAAVRNHEAIHPASDIAVCEFETPIAKRGGPYTGYPVFNVPPEVADAAASVATPPARTPPTIHGIRVPTASPACGIRSRPRASRRPVRTRTRRTPPSRWSSTRPRARQARPGHRHGVAQRHDRRP